jgi:hypothetical protein
MTTAITTITKILEALPESEQEQIVEHVRTYVAEMQDEAAWDALFRKTQSKLIAATRLAKQEIAAGQAKPKRL